MSFIFAKPPFQFAICLRMLYPCQDWLDAMAFDMLLEIAIPFAVRMNAMGTEFSTMIHDELSHWTEPPVSLNQLIHHQLAILGIDILELPTGKDHPGCVIDDNANLEIRPP